MHLPGKDVFEDAGEKVQPEDLSPLNPSPACSRESSAAR